MRITDALQAQQSRELVLLNRKNASMLATLTIGDAPRMASCGAIGSKGRRISLYLPLISSLCDLCVLCGE